MQITRIEAIPVCVPLKKGMTAKTAHGEHVTSPYVIVKVHTDAGLVGLGEATISGAVVRRDAGRARSRPFATTSPRNWSGKDPRDITAARRAMDFIIKLNPFTKAAVEMALWDIAGKAVGLPVYQLLGGKVRDRVRIKLVVWARDVPGSRAMAEQHLEAGRDVREGEDRPRPGKRHRPRAGRARGRAGRTFPSPSTPTAGGRFSRRSTASARWRT